MAFRFTVPLLLAGAFALAFSHRSHSSEPARHPRGAGDPAIVSALDIRVAERVEFVFTVRNDARKRVELTFPSGQTHEITVLDSAGRRVWQWSDGRLFTQSMQNEVLDSEETVTYSETWKPGERHGRFTAVATLRSDSHALEERAEFTLR